MICICKIKSRLLFVVFDFLWETIKKPCTLPDCIILIWFWFRLWKLGNFPKKESNSSFNPVHFHVSLLVSGRVHPPRKYNILNPKAEICFVCFSFSNWPKLQVLPTWSLTAKAPLKSYKGPEKESSLPTHHGFQGRTLNNPVEFVRVGMILKKHPGKSTNGCWRFYVNFWCFIHHGDETHRPHPVGSKFPLRSRRFVSGQQRGMMDFQQDIFPKGTKNQLGVNMMSSDFPWEGIYLFIIIWITLYFDSMYAQPPTLRVRPAKLRVMLRVMGI